MTNIIYRQCFPNEEDFQKEIAKRAKFLMHCCEHENGTTSCCQCGEVIHPDNIANECPSRRKEHEDFTNSIYHS